MAKIKKLVKGEKNKNEPRKKKRKREEKIMLWLKNLVS